MFMGRWSCVSFEKDERMFEYLCQNLTSWAMTCTKKINGLQSKVEKEEKLQMLIMALQEGSEVTEDEVSLPIVAFYVLFLERFHA